MNRVVALSEDEIERIHLIEDKADELLELMATYADHRQLRIAKEHLEQAIMWAIKGITG